MKSRFWRRCYLAIAVASTPLAFAIMPASIAEAAPTTTTDAYVDRDKVEIGDTVTYTVKLTVVGGRMSATAVSSGDTPGFRIINTSQIKSSGRVRVGGAVQESISLNIEFTLLAEKLGKTRLGPGSFTIGGVDMPTPRVSVEVVEKGKAPRPPRRRDPFFDSPFFHDDSLVVPPPRPAPTEIAPQDPAAAVESLPSDPVERNAFVRIVVDRSKAKVGEPVEVKAFAYARGRPRRGFRRPPAFPGFALVELGGVDEDWNALTIGRQIWSYALIAHWDAYPLQTGAQAIEPGEALFQRMSPFDSFPDAESHDSPRVTVDVEEPPLDGRPTGYVVGDVASELQIEADATPRSTNDGHVLVTLRMRGEGRLDSLRPRLPTLVGATWTQTGDETRTNVAPAANGKPARVMGARKVTWDLAFDKVGTFDVGEAAVAVWDHRASQYATARAALGSITVSAVPSAATSASADPFPLPPARDDVGARGADRARGDRPLPWLLAFASPLLVLAAQGIARGASAMRARRAEHSARPTSRVALALTTARKERTPAAWLRALDQAIEARAEVVARAEVESSLRAALVARGVEQAEQVVELRRALETARFAGGNAPDDQAIERAIASLGAKL